MPFGKRRHIIQDTRRMPRKLIHCMKLKNERQDKSNKYNNLREKKIDRRVNTICRFDFKKYHFHKL